MSRFEISLLTVEEDTDATVVLWSENGKDDPQVGLNISILPRPQSSTLTKQRGANRTSSQKQRTFNVETIAEVEDVLDGDKRDQKTLLQYLLTAQVVCRLNELQSWNKRGKVA